MNTKIIRITVINFSCPINEGKSAKKKLICPKKRRVIMNKWICDYEFNDHFVFHRRLLMPSNTSVLKCSHKILVIWTHDLTGWVAWPAECLTIRKRCLDTSAEVVMRRGRTASCRAGLTFNRVLLGQSTWDATWDAVAYSLGRPKSTLGGNWGR